MVRVQMDKRRSLVVCLDHFNRFLCSCFTPYTGTVNGTVLNSFASLFTHLHNTEHFSIFPVYIRQLPCFASLFLTVPPAPTHPSLKASLVPMLVGARVHPGPVQLGRSSLGRRPSRRGRGRRPGGGRIGRRLQAPEATAGEHRVLEYNHCCRCCWSS